MGRFSRNTRNKINGIPNNPGTMERTARALMKENEKGKGSIQSMIKKNCRYIWHYAQVSAVTNHL